MWEYIAILLILAVVGYLLFEPLLRPHRLKGPSPRAERLREKELQKRKEDIYAAIKEMDFDLGMGKISREDYEDLRSEYKSRAVQILKELDTADEASELETAIEKEVEQLRKKSKPRKRGGGTAKTTPGAILFCSQCGGKADSNDNFCRDCGAKLRHGRGRD